MPIHDWTRVSAGTWHDFHLAWIAELRNSLNGGLLPSDYSVQTEPTEPDVVIVPQPATPPRTRIVVESEMTDHVLKRPGLVIRHGRSGQGIALLEIVSPGTKSARYAIRSFVQRVVESLYGGYHLLILDLFPPGPRDPNGIHGLIWDEIGNAPFELPPDEPLTLAAYSAGPIRRAYVEPTAVCRELIEMPLFLEPEMYVNAPLEVTYQSAYRGVPRRWKSLLESASA
jgi:hypothetical protein